MFCFSPQGRDDLRDICSNHCCWPVQKEGTCSWLYQRRRQYQRQLERGRRLPAERGRRLSNRFSCLSLFPHALHSTKPSSDQNFVSWIITRKRKHGEFFYISVGDRKFLLLILNFIYRLETPIFSNIIFTSERKKWMHSEHLEMSRCCLVSLVLADGIPFVVPWIPSSPGTSGFWQQ